MSSEIEVDVDQIPPVAYSVIAGIRYGWDQDGGCGLPLMECRCKQLTEPAHIKKIREIEGEIDERPR